MWRLKYWLLNSSFQSLNLHYIVHVRFKSVDKTWFHCFQCCSKSFTVSVVQRIMVKCKVVLTNFWVYGRNPMVWPFKWKLVSKSFRWYCFLCCTRWFYLLSLWNESLRCDHSNESYWAALSCGAVYYAVESGSNFLVCGWNPLCDHSNKSFWAAFSGGAIYYAIENASNLFVCGRNRMVWQFK